MFKKQKKSHLEIRRKIGSGKSSSVFLAQDNERKLDIALKIQSSHSCQACFLNQIATYKKLKKFAGLPEYYFSHKDKLHSIVLGLELLGPSLSALELPFSLKTTLMLAQQMISRLESLHRQGIMHCDIKPSNFLMKAKMVYIIDFGLASNIPKEEEYQTKFKGTYHYASHHSQAGLPLSPKDDLISLGFVLVEFLKGKLPWSNTDHDEMLALKSDIKHLCEGLPEEFETYFKLVNSLEDGSVYRELKSMLKDLFYREGYIYDLEFDWHSSH